MAIYIKGMEIPKEGYVDVRLFSDGRATTQTGEHPFYREMKITEVKEPHGDMIDRDSLMRTLAENKEYFEHEGVNCCCYFRNSADEPSTELWCVDDWIDGQPTVIERSEE